MESTGVHVESTGLHVESVGEGKDLASKVVLLPRAILNVLGLTSLKPLLILFVLPLCALLLQW